MKNNPADDGMTRKAFPLVNSGFVAAGRRSEMNRFRILMIVAAAVMLLCASTLSAQVSEFGAAEAYVVKKGDTAASIAKRHYGKSSLGAKLWQANKNLVAHPKRLTVGDTIYLFPESALVANKSTAVPPPPLEKPTELYDRGKLLDTTFPKYFNFVADGRGLGESGSVRIKVKKTVKETADEAGYDVDELYEVRDVGHIIASAEHPGLVYGDGADKARYFGKVMLSTNDQITVQFTEDLAKILDSDTYGDTDPYFREFPIYGPSFRVNGSQKGRVDYGRAIGEIYQYKGTLTVVARVEGLAPQPPNASKHLKKRSAYSKNQDIEPVSYVARITSAVDVVELDDHIFIFVPLLPGPERTLEPPFVEQPDSYVSLGD